MNPRRWIVLLAAAALVAGAAALVVVAFFRVPPQGPKAVNLDPAPTPPDAPIRASESAWKGTEPGGTFAGVVVDHAERPIANADVILVGLDEDAKIQLTSADADGESNGIDVPVFGDYRIAARGRSDASGRFSLAAGAARIVALVAWDRAYAPGMVAHTKASPLRPGDGHVIHLAAAGWLKGRVLDAATRAPVARAEVVIYLQQRANQGETPGPEKVTPSNAFGIFQRFVSHVLGPMVWGVEPPPGDTGFHVTTTNDGWFTFGPLMSEAQVEVVITHPDYSWVDFDAEKTFAQDQGALPDRGRVGRIVRTVVPPGETVEREYLLPKGEEIRGTVVDADGKPIQGVQIALEHVAQYAQHWRYRTHARPATTDAKGRFRIAGLSFDPYVLRMTHPSFDTEFFSGVRKGSDTVYKVQSAGGWIDLTVEGGPEGTPQWSARAIVELAGVGGAARQEQILVREGHATIERLKPGRYLVTLMSGTKISTPGVAEIRAGEPAQATVTMAAGGGLRLSVRDVHGKPLDPATAELMVLAEDGAERRAAVLVSREGVVSSGGLLAGRYAADVRVPGYVPVRTPPFDVVAGRETEGPAVVLRQLAYVQLTGVSDEAGRPITGDVILMVADGGAEPTRRQTRENGRLPVTPGSVILKADTTDGRHFEITLDVGDGATVPVEIRFPR